jgi:eukaryotic-like serine/threonine-protein kinase
MGEVYRARDTRLNRTVAIKVLGSGLSTDPVAEQRLEREARVVAALSHPYICPANSTSAIRTRSIFWVTEYLDGETLAERLSGGKLLFDQSLKCGIEIADALAAARRAGIIHRDLKPGNIMLTKSGAKLLDFGLAKMPTQAAVAGLCRLFRNASDDLITLTRHVRDFREFGERGRRPIYVYIGRRSLNANQPRIIR